MERVYRLRGIDGRRFNGVDCVIARSWNAAKLRALKYVPAGQEFSLTNPMTEERQWYKVTADGQRVHRQSTKIGNNQSEWPIQWTVTWVKEPETGVMWLARQMRDGSIILLRAGHDGEYANCVDQLTGHASKCVTA